MGAAPPVRAPCCRVARGATVALVLALSLLLVLGGGCGSGAQSASTTAPPLAPPPEGFAAQANTLCALATAHVTAMAPNGGRVASLADLARLEQTVVPVAQGFAHQLRRLSAPAAKRELWRRFLAGLDAELTAEAAVGRAAAAGDPAGARRAVAGARAADPAALATRLGLGQCAHGTRPARGRAASAA